MPIHVSCSHCDAGFNLADGLLGKRVRCRNCSQIFVVKPDNGKGETPKPKDKAGTKGITTEAHPSNNVAAPSSRPKKAAAPPARRRDREDGDEDDRRRPVWRGPSNWLVVFVLICVAGGVLVLGLGGLLFYVLFGQSSPAPVAKNPPASNTRPNPNQNKPDPNKPDPNKPDPNNPKDPPPPPQTWLAAVDPPAQPLKEPADPKKTIPALNSVNVLFPTRTSPFVAIGSNNFDRDIREIWNLESGQKTGALVGKLGVIDPIFLSPDGKYLAGRTLGNGTTFDVFATANGQKVQHIQVDPQIVPLTLTDFAGPDQLVTVKNKGQAMQIQVWDLKTGQAMQQINLTKLLFDPKAFAVSPGGRYLAILDDGKLLVYDLTRGSKTGESLVPHKPGTFVSGPKAMAFSPDGAELAVLFDIPVPQLLVWDMATGEVSKNHELPKDMKSLVPASMTYIHNNLEWVPDRSGWLLYGFFLVDAVSGVPVWTVPSKLEIGFPGPRQLLSPKHLAMTTGNGNNRQIQILELPRNQIDQAVEAARKGNNPDPAQGLPVTAADWSGVRQLPQMDGIPVWNVAGDALPEKKLVQQPIPLKGKGSEISQILFAGKAAQAAVVSVIAPTDPLRPRQVHADRYDLANGQALGSLNLFGVKTQGMVDLVADLSPDGSCLALIRPFNKKRVDLWSLANGKHLVGLLPYEKEGDPKLRWAAMLDEKRLLTASTSGKLTLWSVPECKAVYTGEGFRGSLALSPGRKYLVASRGTAFLVLDTATGAARGQLAVPAGAIPENSFGMAFRTDGRALAGVVNTEGFGLQLVRWDLAKGTITESFPIQTPSWNLQWCGENHVLLESSLVDLNLKAPISSYILPGPGRMSHGSPDGRLWFAFGRGNESSAQLSSQTLPDTATMQLAALLKKPNTQTLLRPGISVSVRVDVAGAGGKAEEIRRRAMDSLTNRLKAGGLKVAEGERLTVLVQLQEKPTGKTTRYDPIGGRGAPIIVQVKQIVCQATLTGPGGMIWQDKPTTFQTPDAGIVRAENVQTTLDEQLWGRAGAWAGGLNMPIVLVRIGGKVEALPRIVPLTGDR
jgi:WD40 repeat protein